MLVVVVIYFRILMNEIKFGAVSEASYALG